jgi:two-component sensor histidine kinase
MVLGREFMRSNSMAPAEETEERSGPALDKVRRHIRILGELGKLAGERGGLDSFLDRIVQQVARAVEIHHVKVLQYRPSTADLIVAAGVGWKPGVVGAAVLPSDMRSPPGRTWQTAEPLIISRLDSESEFVFSELLKEHDIVSLANVPVMVDGFAWGVLEVDSSVERDFSEDTLDFLIAAGTLVGAVIQGHAATPVEVERQATAAVEARYSELLLREMQHRVKNNFQLILSSVFMQKRRYRSEEVHKVLDHVAGRIYALSLAHDQLAPRGDTQVVKLADYLRALCHSLRQQVENIEIEVEADELEMTVDRAVSLGLILNEAAVNSIKHAFGEQGGRIRVRLEGGVGYGEGRLTVSDNGKGTKKSREGGSGLKFIESLARQIGAKAVHESSEQGTTVMVVFPIIS